MKTIYLAGPDVFLPNAIEVGNDYKTLCAHYGFKGLFPLDNNIAPSTPHEMAHAIFRANQALIHQSDIIIANFSPFRGPEPDSGTVWEVGYAQGLGKKVLAYSSDMRTLKEKTQDYLHLGDASSDPMGLIIEDFGLTHNLMFAHLVVASSFEGCLKILQNKF